MITSIPFLYFVKYIIAKKKKYMEKQNSQKQETRQAELNKIRYFLVHNSNQQPSLPSPISIFQLLRQYLNDDDFTVSLQGEMIFRIDSYEPRLQLLYQQWSEESSQLNINQFVQFWIKNEPELKVSYSLYDQIQEENKQVIYNKKTVFETSRFPQPNRPQPSIIKSISKKKRVSELGNAYSSEMSIEYLRQFFMFFCKQATSKIDNSTFEKYEQYYNELNLTKWMHYLRDVGYFKFAPKIKQKQYKAIFIKFQNTNKCLTFEKFSLAVHQVLEVMFKDSPNQVKQRGYEVIGIKNHQTFKNKFRQMGMLAPVISSKGPAAKKKGSQRSVLAQTRLQTLPDSQTSLNVSLDRLLPQEAKQEKITKSEERSNTLPLRETRASQQLNDTSISSKLYLNRSKRRVNLKDVIKEEEEDLYLQRYMHKQNVDHYHYISHRIDERINKIVNKY